MQYNIGDKVVRLQSRPNDMWVLGSTPVTIADLQDNNVKFLEQETLVGVDYWGLNCYELYQPKPTFTNKEQAMNSMVVSDLTPKKQRKLAAVLDSLGYTFDHDLGLAHHIVVRFDDKSYSTNFGGHARRNTDRVYIYAEGKKYKAILAEVLAALPVTPTKDFKDGCKVRVIENQGDYISAGAVGVLRNIQSGKVTFANDFWWLGESNLEVVPDDTPVTDDKGNPVEVPQVFEVGCTVERTAESYNGMVVGDTAVVLSVEPSKNKTGHYNVTLDAYTGYGKHCTENLKVIKGA